MAKIQTIWTFSKNLLSYVAQFILSDQADEFAVNWTITGR